MSLIDKLSVPSLRLQAEPLSLLRLYLYRHNYRGVIADFFLAGIIAAVLFIPPTFLVAVEALLLWLAASHYRHRLVHLVAWTAGHLVCPRERRRAWVGSSVGHRQQSIICAIAASDRPLALQSGGVCRSCDTSSPSTR